MKTKDLEYWKNNCEEDYLHTPISVLRYISELEEAIDYVHSSLPLNENEGTSIEEYATELINIIQNPNNSNKEWRDVVIENTLEKINKRMASTL